jgi:hypothetical protein
MTVEVGTETAQPHMFDVMTADLVSITDPKALHDAIIAKRNRLNQEAQLLTRWADSIRERQAAATSQRKAAAKLGVSRGAVRPKK